MSSPPPQRPARSFRRPQGGSRPNPNQSGRSGRRPPRLAEGRIPGLPVDVTIDRIVGEGKGIGFADGMTIFVPLTAPGDMVRVRITRLQGTVAHAEIEEILAPSPIRIEPTVADVAASGGLDLQHIGYADQLEVKTASIVDSLRRIAKLDPVPEIPITASPQEWRYRTRAEFQVDHGTGAVGYFAPNSHRVVDVEESPVLTLEVQALLTTLRDDKAANIVPRAAREYRAVSGDAGSVLEPTYTSKSRLVMRQVGEDMFRFSAECFFQSNIPVTRAVLDRVNEIADVARDSDGIALDLYCGVGLFTVSLARRFARVVGVESMLAATKYAEENLATAELRNARFVTAPVEHWIAGDRSPIGRLALAVFDPPRTGAGRATIQHLLRLKPAHVAAVSCDPATFARDIRVLVEGGYEIVDVQAYDMFPQTHHVEIVGHLRRPDA